MTAYGLPYATIAGLLAMAGGVAAAAVGVQWRVDMRRHQKARQVLSNDGTQSQEKPDWAVSYAMRLSRGLESGAVKPLNPLVRSGRSRTARSNGDLAELMLKAGLSESLNIEGYREAQLRFAVLFSILGALLGSVFSGELAAMLACGGLVLGFFLLKRRLRTRVRLRSVEAQRSLPEMLEVIALGLRSGLSFDRSFYLYASHFDSSFAAACSTAYRSWSLGLTTRQDALRKLSDSYDCEGLKRAVESMSRSLHFGSSLAERLEDAAAQARAEYRSKREERIAKAPVKMMLPTGALILPAMLMLVLGPILLELAGGF